MKLFFESSKGKTKTAKPTVRSENKSSAPSTSNDSWLTKYYPSNLSEVSVAVNHAYRTKVRDWLQSACMAHADQDTTPHFKPQILALCGPSGCGKSTLVEVLCNEMDIDAVVWHDEMWDSDASSSLYSDRQFASSGDKLFAGGNSNRQDTREERLNNAEQMEAFVLQSKYPKLVFGTSEAGPKPIASDSVSSTSNVVTTNQSLKAANPSTFPLDCPWRRIILIHDPPHMMAENDNGGSNANSRCNKQLQKMGELMAKFRDPVVLIISNVGDKDQLHYAETRCLPRSIRTLVSLTGVYQSRCTVLKTIKLLKMIAEKERIKDLPQALLEGIAESSNGDLRHAVLQLQFLAQSSGPVLKSSNGAAKIISSQLYGNFDFSFSGSSLCMKAGDAGREEDGEEAPREGKRRRGDMIKTTGSSKLKSIIVRGEDQDGCVMDLFASADGGCGRVERRDAHYSGLHSVGKICHAACDNLDALPFDCDQVVYRSELDLELLIPFVQFNVVQTIEQTARIECWPSLDTLRTANHQVHSDGTASEPPSEGSLDVHLAYCEQASVALTLCSDIQLLLDQKYDPSAQIDRSASNIFPADYCCSLLSRVGCTARGVGALERRQRGKDRGAKAPFQPMYRPAAFDLHSNRARIEGNLRALREEMIPTERNVTSGLSIEPRSDSSEGPPVLYSSTELALTLCPYMQTYVHSAFTFGMRPHINHGAVSPRMGIRVLERLRAIRALHSKPTHDDYAIPRSEEENDLEAYTKVIGAVEADVAGGDVLCASGIYSTTSELPEDIGSFDD